MPNQYKYLPLISMLYSAAALLSLVIAQRQTLLFGFPVMCASFVYPITFTLSDVMTEIYGYQRTAQVIAFSFFLQFFFALMCFGFTHLPAPNSSHNNAEPYLTVLGHLLRICSGSLIAAIVGSFINISMLSKLKLIYAGRYFALRSLASSFIGELLYTFIAIMVMFYGKAPLFTLSILMLQSMSIKIVYNLISVIPSTLSVNLLHKIECIKEVKPKSKITPFSINTT